MSAQTSGFPAARLVAAGLVARPDTVAEIRETVGDPHSGPGGRAYRVTMAGGLSVEVLPERGLDLGSLWYAGQPIAWRSALGPRGAGADPAGVGWIGRFTGGILATCGLDNIGPARDGLDLHGSHHGTPAEDVVLTRTDAGVQVSGTIDSSGVFGRRVEVRRRILVHADTPAVSVRDVVTNLGTTPAATPLLYHLNFGAPLVMPGTRIEIDARLSAVRDIASADFDWHAFPEPTTDVLEHVVEHRGLRAGEDGVIEAVVRSAAVPVTATIRWRPEELPRCFQWVYPTRGGWALGIEPANSPLFGPDRFGPDAGAPVLQPGESRQSGIVLELSTGSPGSLA